MQLIKNAFAVSLYLLFKRTTPTIKLIVTSTGIIITSAIETLGSPFIKIISREITIKSTKKNIVSFFSKMCQLKVAPNAKINVIIRISKNFKSLTINSFAFAFLHWWCRQLRNHFFFSAKFPPPLWLFSNNRKQW